MSFYHIAVLALNARFQGKHRILFGGNLNIYIWSTFAWVVSYGNISRFSHQYSFWYFALLMGCCDNLNLIFQLLHLPFAVIPDFNILSTRSVQFAAYVCNINMNMCVTNELFTCQNETGKIGKNYIHSMCWCWLKIYINIL